jgi:hypothetical protein
MIWKPVTTQTISQREALQNNDLTSTQIELIKALTTVLQIKCYFPFHKTHIKRFHYKYPNSILNRKSNKISWNEID